MDYDVVFKNVEVKKLNTFYVIRLLYNENDINSVNYYRANSFEEASCIFYRVINELKNENSKYEYDKNILSVSIVKEEIFNTYTNGSPLVSATRAENWNIVLTNSCYFG